MTWDIILFLIVAVLVHIAVYLFVVKKNPKNISGRHVVITGGSKGIGLCLAVECAMKGAHVTVIARDAKSLTGAISLMEVVRQRADQKFQSRSLDISTSYEEVADVFSEVENSLGDIYMLINCAGLAICGVFEEVSVDDMHKMMNINYYGSFYCIRYVLPKMKKRQEGIIVITSSQAAMFGIYGYGPYAASKYALRAMAETIAMETTSFKEISVTLAMPCDTNTPGFKNEEKSKPRETKIISSGGGLMAPEKVAKCILNDALKGTFSSTVGIESYIITLLGGALLPWNGLFTNLLQSIFIGPLRLFSYGLHIYFQSVIQKCAKTNLHKTQPTARGN